MNPLYRLGPAQHVRNTGRRKPQANTRWARAQPTKTSLSNANPKPQTALLPAGLIGEGEEVLWLSRPSLWFLILPAWRAYLIPILAAVVVIAAGGTNDKTPLLLAGMGIVLLARMSVQWLRWVSRVYVITDQQVIMIRGVLTTQTLRVSLTQVQHTQVVRGFLEQLTGIGTIQAATAGTGYSELVWSMVTEPYRVQELLEKTRQGKTDTSAY